MLNDVDVKIAPATRQRVRLAAQELGYIPNAVARALLRHQMDTLGVVLPAGAESPARRSFFSILFESLCKAAARHQQNLTLFTGHFWQNAEVSLPFYRDGRCDGLIVVYQRMDSDLIPALVQSGAPIVLVNQRYDHPDIAYVDVDDEQAAYETTCHLLVLGHRSICLDEDIALQFLPTITTMRQPYQAIADTAVDLLLQQIHPSEERAKRVLLPARLIVRDSTGPAPII